MDNKKIGWLIPALIMLALFSAVAFADEASAEDSEDTDLSDDDSGYGETLEDDTINEVKDFGSSLGARIRLLQLECSITRNILWGEAIIAAIEDANSSADTSELEGIVAELKALRSEVADIAPAAGENSTSQFVDAKERAIELTQEFRKLARSMLKISDVEGLRKNLSAMKWNETKSRIDRIHEAQREFNARKLNETFEAIGASNPPLVDAVLNGNASLKDVKDALRGELSNMTKEERKEALLAVKEQISKRNVLISAAADRIRYNRAARLQDRLHEQLEDAQEQNLSDAAQERLMVREQKVNDTIGRIENRTQWRTEQVHKITAKRVENIEKLIDKAEDRGDRTQERLQERLEEDNLTEGERNRVENRIGDVENRTNQVEERLQDRIEEIEDRGLRLEDRLGGWNQSNGSGQTGNGKGHGKGGD